ncbi:hypothetical protein HBI56_026010 [Parastagonospora nodorum]|uniref:Uncharacterized protein n=1 Tax=Phaeosphaeria nodorum (strain SN15 / ATCC MYA-4574 / FGSC 10173) TaxID=321614 RepID=Q0V036_PHANO|nr:hypothetical protein SNOG_02628 [Parastagonospora nodorum SN15]KAH3919384.1 hypothetical protein HBH56_013670 [Parastagonospora nodorum]EAT89359.1 hypothetical protein SNOG_02628 [Parastagonospora nodorum SN15]KAH3937257.1 hypothetical protein HBH54_020790 [Parastagonospora nodorum]KAH3953467.1 hypothetical protein HBH53_033190 [Parastagonospora nodorum]KAH4097226.1 hypothetical protein HBH48_043640 [Parastagonospora nodorum]
MVKFQGLNRNRKSPITGERKEELEALRKNNVPRYLFRAWHLGSGGAPGATLNTINTIMPHVFMPRAHPEYEKERPSFYQMPENQLHRMATGHYDGKTDVISGFSSWAASLHLVLCYAMFLKKRSHDEVHVAVMDTHDLSDEVLVWHVPHLIGEANHEYLAFGRIMGNGYHAVKFYDLEQHGILNLLPETRNCLCERFGSSIRQTMFTRSAVDIGEADLDSFRVIGSLFGKLSFPVITALASLRPRHWRACRKAGGHGPWWRDNKDIIAKFARELRMAHAPTGLREEPWLAFGMVDTKDFPDVEQWIDLMSMFAELLSEQHQLPSQAQHRQIAGIRPHLLEETAAMSPEHPETANPGGKRKRKVVTDQPPAKRTLRGHPDMPPYVPEETAAMLPGKDEAATAGEKRKKKGGEDLPPAKRALRDRGDLIYTECRGGKCGKCMTCRPAR